MKPPQFYPIVDASHPSDRLNDDDLMLGDNSLASQDSRYFGQVPAHAVRKSDLGLLALPQLPVHQIGKAAIRLSISVSGSTPSGALC